MTAGTAFGFTVTAENASGSVDTQYSGTVTVLARQQSGRRLEYARRDEAVGDCGQRRGHFLGVDTRHRCGWVLPDGGGQQFPRPEPGRADDRVNVVPGAVTKLVVTSQPPGTVAVGQGFACTVVAEDRYGNVATNYSGQVTLSLATSSGGSGTGLSVPTTFSFDPRASPGYVTLSGLSVNNAVTGDMLNISLSSGVSTSTNTFNVTAPLPVPTIIGESAVMSK